LLGSLLDQQVQARHEGFMSHVVIYNYLGLKVNICLDVNSDSLKCFREAKDNDIIWTIQPGNALNLNMQKLEQKVKEKEVNFDKKVNSLKIVICIQGFKPIQKINIMNTGTFGYFLHEKEDKRMLNFNNNLPSDFSCVIRQKKINTQV